MKKPGLKKSGLHHPQPPLDPGNRLPTDGTGKPVKGARKNMKQKGGGFFKQGRGFLTPLISGKMAKKEIRAAERLEFNPLERSIQGELGGSARRQQEIPAWFQNYQNALQGSVNRSQSAYDQAQSDFSKRLGEAGANDTSARQDMMQRAQADAALRGVQTDYSGAQAGLEADNARQQLQARVAGTIGTQGANQLSYLADAQRIGSREGIEQMLKEQERERGIRSDLRELALKKGDFRTKYLADLRESDRKYKLESKATGAKTGYNKAIIKQAKLGNKGRRITAQGQKDVANIQQKTQQGSNKTQKQVAKTNQKGGGGKKKGL